jgi:hypothetical protein
MKRISVEGVEKFREYIYADGFTYRIDEPLEVFIRETSSGHSHRVVDSEGMAHYMPTGWRVLRWKGEVIA